MVGKKKQAKKPKDESGIKEITISHCNLTGVQWDEKSTEAISSIAEALKENASALGKLASAIQSPYSNIKALLYVDGGGAS